MNKTRLNNLIERAALLLQPDLKFASATGVLTAIATVESSFGSNTASRFEKSYAPLGRYYVVDQKDRYTKWGSASCCSYGSFQIMYPTACEMGFDNDTYLRSPHLLTEDEIGIFYVIELIKKRVLARGASTLEQLFDAYNSGSFRDSIIPTQYIKDAISSYNSANKIDYIP